MKKLYFLYCFALLTGCKTVQLPTGSATFTNPLLPSGADPWSIYKDGFYYYTNTVSDSLVIWKTATLAALATAQRKTIWIPPPNTTYSKQLWAPEIHFLEGKWYVYFAADDGDNRNHRIYAVENANADPMQGEWTFKGKIATPQDKWAIDASVFRHEGKLYMTWSGWEGDTNGRQDIYIAAMQNPWTVTGERVRISSPTYTWELNGTLKDASNPAHVAVNEGPQYLARNNKTFMVYSASGCWTDQYALGMLTLAAGGNVLDSASWKKSTEPVFSSSVANGVYAPGHNSFFTSPNGKEDWILYHANSQPGQGCGRHRTPRAQKFRWKNGQPIFGEPMPTGVPVALPRQ